MPTTAVSYDVLADTPMTGISTFRASFNEFAGVYELLKSIQAKSKQTGGPIIKISPTQSHPPTITVELSDTYTREDAEKFIRDGVLEFVWRRPESV